jgi:hypothetical protein
VRREGVRLGNVALLGLGVLGLDVDGRRRKHAGLANAC